MQIEFKGNPKPFGTIGLVLAILSLLFSLIPCVGFYALIPALLAVIFCTIAFLYLRQNGLGYGVPLGGIIVGAVAIVMGIYQYVQYQQVFEAKSELNKIESELTKEVLKKALKDHDSIHHIGAADSLPR